MTARAAVQVDHMMRVGAKVGTGRAFGIPLCRGGWRRKQERPMMVVTHGLSAQMVADSVLLGLDLMTIEKPDWWDPWRHSR